MALRINLKQSFDGRDLAGSPARYPRSWKASKTGPRLTGSRWCSCSMPELLKIDLNGTAHKHSCVISCRLILGPYVHNLPLEAGMGKKFPHCITKMKVIKNPLLECICTRAKMNPIAIFSSICVVAAIAIHRLETMQQVGRHVTFAFTFALI